MSDAWPGSGNEQGETRATVAFSPQVVDGRHGPIQIRVYHGFEKEQESQPLVWVHGGAFSYGGLDQLESHAPAMAIAESGRDVITIDYHRVPRWSYLRDPPPGDLPGVRFPIPVDDVTDVLQHVIRETEGGRVILGGASAGACLAAAAALRLRRADQASPVGLALAYGTFHAELPPIPPALRSRLRGRHALMQFRARTVHRMNLNYAGRREAMSDPYAFPGGHDLTGLPRTLIMDADRDSLRASGASFVEELHQAGVPADYLVVPDSPHGFLDRPNAQSFQWGIAAMISWLDRGDAAGCAGTAH